MFKNLRLAQFLPSLRFSWDQIEKSRMLRVFLPSSHGVAGRKGSLTNLVNAWKEKHKLGEKLLVQHQKDLSFLKIFAKNSKE